MPYYAPFTQGNDGLILWLNLDPDYRTTSTTINDWKNFMKPSEVFSQSNASRRPTDNGTHITFDGGDFLGCNVDRILDTSNDGWTLYIRYKEDDWSANSAISGDDSSNNSFIKNVGDGLSIKATGTSGSESKGFNFNAPSDLVDDQYYNIAVTATSSGLLTIYIDGVAQNDTEQFSDNTYDLIFSEVGGKNSTSWLLEGSIQEILIIYRELSATNILDIHTYLNNKF